MKAEIREEKMHERPRKRKRDYHWESRWRIRKGRREGEVSRG